MRVTRGLGVLFFQRSVNECIKFIRCNSFLITHPRTVNKLNSEKLTFLQTLLDCIMSEKTYQIKPIFDNLLSALCRRTALDEYSTSRM